MTVRTLTVCALFAALGTALAQPPKATEPAGAPVPAQVKAEKVDLNKLLAGRVALGRYEGKFRDAVDVIATAYELPLVLTRQGDQGHLTSDETVRGELAVKLPRLTSVKIETILTMLCEQAEAKFLVYPDHIKIVPDTFAAYESGVLSTTPDPTNGEDAPLLTVTDLLRSKPLTKRGLVNASFKNKPLAEIIDEIAEATGANVTLSPTVPAAVRQAPVTIRFANAPVDAAVRTLCEMTDTGAIEDANVLLVTTRERAAARAKEEAQKLKDRNPQAPAALFNGIPAPLTAQPDPNGELAKLKERNEQLAKQLDALTKRLDELKPNKP
ncbi:DUF5320 domain-containing protein [Gemmata sp. JC717]|uniref:DUF5320 domain-containing protein n=1 Tax=Gemmata algarum TaxID=2975278 RepID=A0ABU5F1N1_9BACT|nr:DUF5320 domain-containing protein [Gemmata algarum]MDY3551892.1 DUF5320 domain-containing protein [Gemmata algarum]MDY3559769.1 DUF5320 domain-containing protein [Gemmata algarum]